MSLRLRLLIVASLAVVALATAIVTVLQLVAAQDSLGVAEAIKSNASALGALAAGVRGQVLPADRDAQRARLAAIAKSQLASTVETRGGYCWRDGDFIEQQSQGMRDHGGPPGDHRGPPRGDTRFDEGPPGPPEDVRAALVATCRAGEGRATPSIRTEATIVDVRAIGPNLSAFAMRIVPRSPDAHWPPALGVIALATLLVIALNLTTLWSLRNGATQLKTALAELELDPRAEIIQPATPELADVAVGVRGLARRLADAQAHELELERGNAHQKRMSSLGHLVAGIAHEVRNPLTGMKLLLDGIRRREANPKTREDVDLALAEIQRLDKLVTASLGVARDTRFERSEVNLAHLVDERLAASQGHAALKQVVLRRHGEATRLADRDAIVRIVDNLVRNAIDASPEGGAVEVEIAATSIEVRDRGAGVPEAQVATLFEPFVTSKPEGTGLGLWMSLALAEARGGTVRYRRAAGMTHFTLDLGDG